MILSELAADRATRFNQYKNELASSMKKCKGNVSVFGYTFTIYKVVFKFIAQ